MYVSCKQIPQASLTRNLKHKQETALENERKKAEKLDEKCEVLCGQIERLKASVEESDTSRRKLREELEVSAGSGLRNKLWLLEC